MAFKQTHDSKNSRTRNDEENTDTLRKFQEAPHCGTKDLDRYFHREK